MSARAKPSIRPLRGVVKDYAWGIRGNDSRVARYALESDSIADVDPAAPYAELWLGTHPKGPSTLEDGTPLEEVVGGALPFLFKILSAGKALSIQAHPDKANAQRLHAADPGHYADANHKPELAIALTPFEVRSNARQDGHAGQTAKAREGGRGSRRSRAEHGGWLVPCDAGSGCRFRPWHELVARL